MRYFDTDPAASRTQAVYERSFASAALACCAGLASLRAPRTAGLDGLPDCRASQNLPAAKAQSTRLCVAMWRDIRRDFGDVITFLLCLACFRQTLPLASLLTLVNGLAFCDQCRIRFFKVVHVNFHVFLCKPLNVRSEVLWSLITWNALVICVDLIRAEQLLPLPLLLIEIGSDQVRVLLVEQIGDCCLINDRIPELPILELDLIHDLSNLELQRIQLSSTGATGRSTNLRFFLFSGSGNSARLAASRSITPRTSTGSVGASVRSSPLKVLMVVSAREWYQMSTLGKVLHQCSQVEALHVQALELTQERCTQTLEVSNCIAIVSRSNPPSSSRSSINDELLIACVDLRVCALHSVQGCFRAKRTQISTTVAASDLRQLVFELWLERRIPPLRVNVNYSSSRLLSREGEVELAIETAWSSQCWIDRVRASRVATMEAWICSCLLDRTASPTHLLKASAPLRMRAMKQDTSWRCDMEALEDLWIKQRQRDHFLQPVDVVVKTTHPLKTDVWINSKRIRIGKGLFVLDLSETRRPTSRSLYGIAAVCLWNVGFWESGRRGHANLATNTLLPACSSLIVTAIRIHTASRFLLTKDGRGPTGSSKGSKSREKGAETTTTSTSAPPVALRCHCGDSGSSGLLPRLRRLVSNWIWLSLRVACRLRGRGRLLRLASSSRSATSSAISSGSSSSSASSDRGPTHRIRRRFPPCRPHLRIEVRNRCFVRRPTFFYVDLYVCPADVLAPFETGPSSSSFSSIDSCTTCSSSFTRSICMSPTPSATGSGSSSGDVARTCASISPAASLNCMRLFQCLATSRTPPARRRLRRLSACPSDLLMLARVRKRDQRRGRLAVGSPTAPTMSSSLGSSSYLTAFLAADRTLLPVRGLRSTSSDSSDSANDSSSLGSSLSSSMSSSLSPYVSRLLLGLRAEDLALDFFDRP
ncbi:hypothetical protein KC325_g186 [Hortaea werneckii]|nr:hypothetical protein KC325_g186 [Hortaea werneckii]